LSDCLYRYALSTSLCSIQEREDFCTDASRVIVMAPRIIDIKPIDVKHVNAKAAHRLKYIFSPVQRASKSFKTAD
jgi:hypothetical protein